MNGFSTRQAAKKLGMTHVRLSRYIAAKKIPTPQLVSLGSFRVHVWSKEDIERVRELLPKIANGRKTRYAKKQLAVNNQQLAEAKPTTKPKPRIKKQPQPKSTVPHNKKK